MCGRPAGAPGEPALVWLAEWSQTATSSIRLARAVEAARLSQEQPAGDRVIAYCPEQQAVGPGQVPGAGDGPVCRSGWPPRQVPVDGQFGCGFERLPDGLLRGVQQLVHLLVVSEMRAGAGRSPRPRRC